MNIREEIRAWLDSCYSDRPDNGYWMIFEYHLDQLEQLFQKEVVAELEKLLNPHLQVRDQLIKGTVTYQANNLFIKEIRASIKQFKGDSK